MEKYFSLYILLLLCLKVNVCVLGGLLVSKKDIDLAKSIVKARNGQITNHQFFTESIQNGTVLM